MVYSSPSSLPQPGQPPKHLLSVMSAIWATGVLADNSRAAAERAAKEGRPSQHALQAKAAEAVAEFACKPNLGHSRSLSTACGRQLGEWRRVRPSPLPVRLSAGPRLDPSACIGARSGPRSRCTQCKPSPLPLLAVPLRSPQPRLAPYCRSASDPAAAWITENLNLGEVTGTKFAGECGPVRHKRLASCERSLTALTPSRARAASRPTPTHTLQAAAPGRPPTSTTQRAASACL